MGGQTPGWAVTDPGNYRNAQDLLAAGQYARVAEILQQACVTSELRGDQATAHVLAVACRLCLVCSQSHVEVEWYRRAYDTAHRQEHDLQRRLSGVLDLIAEIDKPQAREALAAILASDLEPYRQQELLPAGADCVGLWQRIRTFVARRLHPGAAPAQQPAVALETTIHSLPDKEAAPAPLSPQPPEPFAVDERPGRPSGAPALDREPEDRPEPVPETPLSTASERDLEAHTFAVFCLGPFRIYYEDQPITDWNSLKARSILKYLVTHREMPVVKDVLMDLFWPDADPGSARRSLHQAIYSLRQTLRQSRLDFHHVQFRDDCYLLNLDLDIWVDVEEFAKHAGAGRRLEEEGRVDEAMAEYEAAETLYQGDFMEEDLYEDWPVARRTQLQGMYLDLADRLSAFYVQEHRYTTAISLCQRTLACDGCYEAAHRRLMQCYLARGQRYLAVRQYQSCVQALQDELGLQPSDETEALYRRITGDT